jgi:UDP-N-acetylglucosamine diphosphorylase/glucosamine-1-phosphate N-acetyltransferase
MRKIILQDPKEVHDNLLPLTYTRPVSDIIVGINTIKDKWKMYLPGKYAYQTEEYLSEKFPCPEIVAGDLIVTGNVVPEEQLAKAVGKLKEGELLFAKNSRGEEILVASCVGENPDQPEKHYPSKVDTVDFLYDIFLLNSRKIEEDFEFLTRHREGQSIHRSNTVIGDPELIHIESGAIVEGVVLNASHGPIYVGRDVEIMEGSCLRGPIALGEHSTVNMGSKIYPGTTLGPWCKVGGELNNVVMLGYSNKAHDGFLGNAVIGEWCNLGAGCVASNLKNDYTEIKLWNYPSHRFLKTGLQFCGLIMGDHSKAGINTMFNTATVVGVGVNVYGSGFPRNFIASFSEGGAAGFTDLPMEKFLDIASRMMARRHRALSDVDVRLFESIRRLAENYK